MLLIRVRDRIPGEFRFALRARLHNDVLISEQQSAVVSGTATILKLLAEPLSASPYSQEYVSTALISGGYRTGVAYRRLLTKAVSQQQNPHKQFQTRHSLLIKGDYRASYPLSAIKRIPTKSINYTIIKRKSLIHYQSIRNPRLEVIIKRNYD